MALTYYSGSDFTVHENNICILDELDNNTTTLLLYEAKKYKQTNYDWKEELEKKWKSHTQI